MLLAHSQGRSVRSVGGWSSCRHGDSRLFVRSFARGASSITATVVDVFVCVCVCVRVCVFVCSCIRVFVRSCVFVCVRGQTTTVVMVVVVMVSLVSLACDVGVMVNSVLILSPSRYCTTTTTTNSTRCGIYSVWFRVLSFGF